MKRAKILISGQFQGVTYTSGQLYDIIGQTGTLLKLINNRDEIFWVTYNKQVGINEAEIIIDKNYYAI